MAKKKGSAYDLFEDEKYQMNHASESYSNGRVYYRSGLPSENAIREKEKIRNNLAKQKSKQREVCHA